MEGISSKATGKLENKNKYNSIGLEHQEFSDGSGLEEYSAFYRDLDPQTGRWWQVDPETENMEMWSPYASNYDNPILYQDHLGNEGETCCGGFIDALTDAGDKIMISASGVLWGALNTTTGGLISTDPFNVRAGLTSEKKMYWDNAVTVGQIAPLISPAPGGKGSLEPGLELAPVGGGKGNIKLESISTEPTVPNRVNSKSNSKVNDLIWDPNAPPGTYDNKPSKPKDKIRVVDQKPGEAALNQSEGINNAQEAAANNKASGQKKQTKINKTDKSDGKVQKQLNDVKTLKDAQENF